MTTAPVTTYCGLCGAATETGAPAESGHASCARRLQLEPPRFCSFCARRMKVQVTPLGWSATCVEHGTTSG